MAVFSPASADHGQGRDLGRGVLAYLVADLLVPGVKLSTEPGGIKRAPHFPGIAVGVAGDRGDDDPAGYEPEEQVASVVPDQDADETFERPRDGPVQRHGPAALTGNGGGFAPRRSGRTKSTCRVPYCQLRRAAAAGTKSGLGP